MARKRDEVRVAFAGGEEGKMASARVFESVSQDAREAVEALTRESENLPPEDVLALESRAAAITTAVDEGRAKYELGAYGDALAEFERAQSFIGVGKRLLEAKARFDEPGDMPEEETPEEEVLEEVPMGLAVEDTAPPEATTMMMATEMKVVATNTGD